MSTRPKGQAAARARRPRAHKVRRRKLRYLIAPKPAQLLPQEVAPLEFGELEKHIVEHPAYDYKRTLKPEGVSALSGDSVGAQPVVVARMGTDHIEMLSQMPQLVVEPDMPLDYAAGLARRPALDPGTLVAADSVDISLTIVGPGGEPVAGATVFLGGHLWPYQGVTGPDGKVTMTLRGEPGNRIQSLYVKPVGDYWSTYVELPALLVDTNNVVTLEPLAATLPGFPDAETPGWGERAMRIPELPPTYRGAGVKVAVIDSGAAIGHPDLDHIARGFDVSAKNEVGWRDDTIGHGSHCAGVIAGRQNGRGVLGIAPEAEVHVYKIFPGGRFSDLLDAIDYCINAGIDVANLSLGSDQPSQLVEARFELAKSMGLACVVAAGNSGGPVQHPAASPHVLAVSAIGKQGEYPPSSYHARQVDPDTKVTEEGYFAAKFSCRGPEVGVCAPGVAVVSSVPATSYTAMDGTSMAAPHVTGLAALVLAHHPDFRGQYRNRGPERVERLFEILKQSARPLDFGDPERSGAGLPDAVRAFEAEGAAASAEASPAQEATGLPASALGQLQELLRSVGLASNGAPAPASQVTEAAPAQAGGQALDQLGVLLAEAGLGEEPPPPPPERGGTAPPAVQTLDDLKAAMADFTG
ncbi:MAG: S8 family peptidase [Actinomycetota bacterium]|nr:S8 family peptidase [Actinomycetota bacterium]